MITTEIYNGQGLGNQLWCYVVTRVIAEDNKYDFGIMHPEKFKCLDFLDLDFGRKVIGGLGPEGGPPSTLPEEIKYYYSERKIVHEKTGVDIRIYDENLINIKDGTKIDGVMQDEQYIIHRKNEISEWLKVKPENNCTDYSDPNTCIINFRGGEYIGIRDVFLPQKYWDDAINHMREINPHMKFIVVTDDITTAQKFFPKFKISHESIGSDYSIIHNAYYLILSNSSFAFFPTWLNEKVKMVIAPKYWSQYNTSNGYWGCGYNITKGWIYLDRSGKKHTYDKCVEELKKYNAGQYIDTSPPSRYKNLFWVFYKKIERKIQHNSFINNKISHVLNKSFISRVKNSILFKVKSKFYNTASTLKTLLFKKTNLDLVNNYRKNIKIYDIFTYNGEADILEIRLNILKDVVDEFIIVEAPTTFSGLNKPLYFKEQQERFAPFLSQIKYFIIDDYPNDKELCKLADESSNVPKNGPEHWRREFYQKESIKKALSDLNNDDICFIGDVDEIWNPEIIIDYSKNDLFKLEQNVYTYYLNNRSSEPWAGTLVTKYKNIKNNCLNHLRTSSRTIYTYLNNGGWHFTSMGGLDEVRRKLNDSYTKESYNTDVVQNNLENRFGKSDYIGRKFKFWIDESDLPKYIIENKLKYIKLFKQDAK